MSLRVSHPPKSRPLMIYDGECEFCRRWIARWRLLTGKRVDYAPYQEAAGRYPEIPEERFRRSLQLIEPNGRVADGAEAVARALARGRIHHWPLWLYQRIPGAKPVAERTYRWVAEHRSLLSRLEGVGKGPMRTGGRCAGRSPSDGKRIQLTGRRDRPVASGFDPARRGAAGRKGKKDGRSGRIDS